MQWNNAHTTPFRHSKYTNNNFVKLKVTKKHYYQYYRYKTIHAIWLVKKEKKSRFKNIIKYHFKLL